MFASKIIAALIALGLTVTGAQKLVEQVAPPAAKHTGEATLTALLTNIQALRDLGYASDEAVSTALAEAPDFIGTVEPDGSLRMVIDQVATCGSLVDGRPTVNPCIDQPTTDQ